MNEINPIVYRQGELEALLKVRDRFVTLIEAYAENQTGLNRAKLLGTIFDTVFFIGISNLREHMPSMKEVYLNTNESRNRSLRNLELLERMQVVERVTDSKDSRVKRLTLTETFKNDFQEFIEQWIDSRNKVLESTA